MLTEVAAAPSPSEWHREGQRVELGLGAVRCSPCPLHLVWGPQDIVSGRDAADARTRLPHASIEELGASATVPTSRCPRSPPRRCCARSP